MQFLSENANRIKMHHFKSNMEMWCLTFLTTHLDYNAI